MASSLRTFPNPSSINSLRAPIRLHLRNVYICLFLCIIATGFGAFISSKWMQDLSISGTGTLIFLVLLVRTANNSGKRAKMRIAFLLGFTTLAGASIEPHLKRVSDVDPKIIVTALIRTTIIFGSLTVLAILARRRRWLYLGSNLMLLSITLWTREVVKRFFGITWPRIFCVQFVIITFLMCGLVLYRTQMIIEKRRRRSKDFVAHSLDLFVIFFWIFWGVLHILAHKKEMSLKT